MNSDDFDGCSITLKTYLMGFKTGRIRVSLFGKPLEQLADTPLFFNGLVMQEFRKMENIGQASFTVRI